MRAFFAVDVKDKGIVSKISKLFDQMCEDFVKKVKPNQLHITLLFLGEIKNIEPYKSALNSLDFKNFLVELRGVSAFPNLNNMRVIWIGVKDQGNLSEIHRKLCELLRIKNEFNAKFIPHLTLGRVKRFGNGGLKDFVNKYKEEYFGKFEVREIKLKESILTKYGPIYKDLAVKRYEG